MSRAGYGCEDVDPRGFVSLMDLYENNYMRLRRLIPSLDRLPDNAVSQLDGCLPLYLNIIEHTKFTSTVTLTYKFDDDGATITEPALTLRIYHDAGQVEVLTGHLKHGRQQYDTDSFYAVARCAKNKGAKRPPYFGLRVFPIVTYSLERNRRSHSFRP